MFVYGVWLVTMTTSMMRTRARAALMPSYVEGGLAYKSNIARLQLAPMCTHTRLSTPGGKSARVRLRRCVGRRFVRACVHSIGVGRARTRSLQREALRKTDRSSTNYIRVVRQGPVIAFLPTLHQYIACAAGCVRSRVRVTFCLHEIRARPVRIYR